MNRDYYNRRMGKDGGPPTLTLAEVAAQIAVMYEACDQQAYLQRSFGYFCVDAGTVAGLDGPDLRMAFYLATGIRVDGSAVDAIKEADEVSLFTWIEFIHDHVAKPNEQEGRYHTWSGCGWHYDCRTDRFDISTARNEWRSKVNSVLKFYQGGCHLSEQGEIVRDAPNGIARLITTTLAPQVADTHQAKVANAISTFHLGRSTREQRKQAVRDLIDVLEFHREAVKEHLSKKDEADLFNIANNFALRHHRADQRDDYDDAWLTWMFYVYLATVHLVLGRIHGHEPFSAPPDPAASNSPTTSETDDGDIPF